MGTCADGGHPRVFPREAHPPVAGRTGRCSSEWLAEPLPSCVRNAPRDGLSPLGSDSGALCSAVPPRTPGEGREGRPRGQRRPPAAACARGGAPSVLFRPVARGCVSQPRRLLARGTRPGSWCFRASASRLVEVCALLGGNRPSPLFTLLSTGRRAPQHRQVGPCRACSGASPGGTSNPASERAPGEAGTKPCSLLSHTDWAPRGRVRSTGSRQQVLGQ